MTKRRKINLADISTKPPKDADRKKLEDETKDLAEEIGDLQEKLLANKDHNLLVILQGMDSSGKDGATAKVFQRCSPTGVRAIPFKKPTDEEFAHDFLWRVHRHAPEKGMIHVFNRSHYEDILIQRVHGWISEEHVAKRMAAINAFEQLLEFDNNTTILKFYMHLSQERQAEKLKARMVEEDKLWKHNPSDSKEAKHWDKYRKCYEYVLNESVIPWHIAPVDSRWYRNYFIAKTVAETLRSFNLKWPPLKLDD